MEDYEMALPLCENSLERLEKWTGSLNNNEPGLRAHILCILGRLNQKKGNSNKARELFDRSINICKSIKGGSVQEAITLKAMADLCCDNNDFQKAIILYASSLNINKNWRGLQHILSVDLLYCIGKAYFNIGDKDKACAFLMSASTSVIKLKTPHGELAADINEALSLVMYLKQKPNEAYMFAIESLKLRDNNIKELLNFDLLSIISISESSRLAYAKSKLDLSFFANVIPAYSTAQYLLKWKGVVSESLIKDKNLFSQKSQKETINKMDDLLNCYSKIYMEVIRGDSDEHAKLEEQIKNIKNELQGILASQKDSKKESDITVSELQSKIPSDAIFIDFLEIVDPLKEGDERFNYGAVLTRRNAEPLLVLIPNRARVIDAISDVQKSIMAGNQTAFDSCQKVLNDILWRPIADKIPLSTKRIIICPDGKLSFLSFSTIQASNGSFLAEKYSVSYVTSGRDLFQKNVESFSHSIAIIANPVFDFRPASTYTEETLIRIDQLRQTSLPAFREVLLPPLPGTESEAAKINESASQFDWDVKLLLKYSATENNVRSLKGPGIIHFATHGFYLNSLSQVYNDSRGMKVLEENMQEIESDNRKMVDPMRASGIALSGAGITFKDWSEGGRLNPLYDGILTAGEVSNLNLVGTWLVTLSACETGSGDARSGEGVFGLRRGFKIAGVQNLIMTLWPVSDLNTSEIMNDFYKQAFATCDASASLAKVQCDWLVKLRKEKGSLAAVREAGPFVIAVTGAQPVTATFSIPENHNFLR